MKKLFVGILMVCLIIVFIGCAGMQPIPENEKNCSIEYIIEIQGYEKDYIYDSTKMWIAENFKSAKAVIEYTDKNTGTIIGNGNFVYSGKTYHFTIRVDIKNDKFRLTFTNLKVSWESSYNSGTKGYFVNGVYIAGMPSYTSPGYNGPLRIVSELNIVKPKLLTFGDEIKLYIEQNSKKKDW
jgi:hypothetical protein